MAVMQEHHALGRCVRQGFRHMRVLLVLVAWTTPAAGLASQQTYLPTDYLDCSLCSAPPTGPASPKPRFPWSVALSGQVGAPNSIVLSNQQASNWGFWRGFNVQAPSPGAGLTGVSLSVQVRQSTIARSLPNCA